MGTQEAQVVPILLVEFDRERLDSLATFVPPTPAVIFDRQSVIILFFIGLLYIERFKQ